MNSWGDTDDAKRKTEHTGEIEPGEKEKKKTIKKNHRDSQIWDGCEKRVQTSSRSSNCRLSRGVSDEQGNQPVSENTRSGSPGDGKRPAGGGE